jgi:hypothetical protein
MIGGTYILQMVHVGQCSKKIRELASEIIIGCPPRCKKKKIVQDYWLKIETLV